MDSKVKFISASNFPITRGGQFTEHSHIHYQLYYIVEGSPVFVVGDQTLRIKPGTLFYISPRMMHKMLPLQSNTLHYYEFKVRIDDPYIAANLPPISPLMEGGKYVEDMLGHIFDNWRDRSAQAVENAETILSALFLGFFVRNSHHEKDIVGRISAPEDSPIAKKVVAYIVVNYRNEFSLADLSRELNYNASYLSSTFAKAAGISIVDFLNLYRVRIALSLIIFYARDIADTGQRVGFASPSHFSRTFKKVTGASPRDFKYVFGGPDRGKLQHLFTDEPVLGGGVCTIDEAMHSIRRIGTAVNEIVAVQRGHV